MAKKPMSMKKALAAYEKTPQDRAQDRKGGKGFEGSPADRKQDAAGARKIMAKAKGKK
jgi:hypothetical protein